MAKNKTLQERFIQAVQSSQRGVSSKDMMKILKASIQTVYQTANAIRGKGGKVEQRDGRYVVATFGKTDVPATTAPSKSASLVSLSEDIMTQIADLDPSSREDALEQYRRIELHSGILKAIVNADQKTDTMRRKLDI